MFDPAEAFERALAEAMSVRKEVALTKQKMTEMVVAHDAELTTHRTELIRLGREGSALRPFQQSWKVLPPRLRRRETVIEQSTELKSLRAEVAALRARLGMTESC